MKQRIGPPTRSPSRRKALSGAMSALTAAVIAPTAAGLAGATRAAGVAKAAPVPRGQIRYEILEVGPGKRFTSLTAAGCFMNSEERWNNGYAGAERVAATGFHLIISPGPPGYYTNDSGSHSRRWRKEVGWPPYEGSLLGPVIIEGEPGKTAPVLDTDGYGDGVLYYQTGLFATGSCDATFRHLVFRGFRRQDGIGNYAAIRLGQTFAGIPMNSHVMIEDCEVAGCDNGILGGAPGQSVTLLRCYFHDNGNEAGRSHNIYVSDGDLLVVEDTLSTRCSIGHLLKSRAARTVVHNSRLLGNGGTESACLDVPDAGVLECDDVICEKSPGSDANWIIHYSGENQDKGNGIPFRVPSSIDISNLTLVAPPGLARHPKWGPIVGFANQSGAGETDSGKGSRFIPPRAENVQAFGLLPDKVGLPFRLLRTRPNLDLTSPVQG
jgi:hypothetical protein